VDEGPAGGVSTPVHANLVVAAMIAGCAPQGNPVEPDPQPDTIAPLEPCQPAVDPPGDFPVSKGSMVGRMGDAPGFACQTTEERGSSGSSEAQIHVIAANPADRWVAMMVFQIDLRFIDWIAPGETFTHTGLSSILNVFGCTGQESAEWTWDGSPRDVEIHIGQGSTPESVTFAGTFTMPDDEGRDHTLSVAFETTLPPQLEEDTEGSTD